MSCGHSDKYMWGVIYADGLHDCFSIAMSLWSCCPTALISQGITEMSSNIYRLSTL